MEPKKYGLIIPKKEKKEVVSRVNLFSKDNSDDELSINAKPKLTSVFQKDKFLKKQTQLNIEKALNEDPNCFEYDEIYEAVQSKKISSKANAIKDKKPKYIGKLMQTAQDRKREYERRVERQVQKDRDAEKGLFEDKEAYVTDAYRKKMQIQKEEEEMERKKQLLEEQQDVTKKSDFSEFYRHILDQQTSMYPNNNLQIKQEILTHSSTQSSSLISDDGFPKGSQNTDNTTVERDSTGSMSQRKDGSDYVTQRANLDADDSDINDDDDSEDSESSKSEMAHDKDSVRADKNLTLTPDNGTSTNRESNKDRTNADKDKSKHDKRTVGESLSDARARYLARKNQTYVPIYNN